MPRIVRIAITLFIASTILLLLARQRLIRLKEDMGAGMAEDAIRDENQMIILGMIIAGGLAISGFVMLIVAVARSRNKRLGDRG